MIVVKGDIVVYCDVDETLLIFDKALIKAHPDQLINIGEKIGRPVMTIPHIPNIECLYQHAARGHKIVVWSAGGVEWAERVVKRLGLTDIVALVITKPRWYYDDKRSDDFLPELNRVYRER